MGYVEYHGQEQPAQLKVPKLSLAVSIPRYPDSGHGEDLSGRLGQAGAVRKWGVRAKLISCA